MLDAADGDRAVQKYLWDLCSRSLLLWTNLFVWTFREKTVGQDGRERLTEAYEQHVPMITWPRQDDVLEELWACVEGGEDAIVDKSRDQGASWLNVVLAVWYWLFSNGKNVMFASRVEDLVDKRGDPDSLMWRVDYLLSAIPDWMKPCEQASLEFGGRYRQHLQLINPQTHGTIRGTASTSHIGRGGRRAFVLFDEMAAMENATEAWRSASSTTACRIGNSTPLGAGTEYTNQYERGLKAGKPRVIGLYYYDHPEQGRGREARIDRDGSVTNTEGRVYWWTPWFQNQIQRRDALDLAQNVLADHIAAGDSVFNLAALNRHLRDHAQTPLRAELDMQRCRFVESPNGPWFLWCELDSEGVPIPRDDNYCIGMDPAYGTGAANAAAAVMARDSGEVVAEFADAYTPPQDLAEEMAFAGKYLFTGQLGHAFIGWEENGPGESMHYDFARHNYPHLYYQRQVGQRHERATKRYGWRSGRREKRILVGQLDRAIQRHEIVIHSAEAIEECRRYVRFDDGSVGAGHLRDMTTDAREAHGDRVIAVSLAVLLRREAPAFEPAEKTYPKGTMGQIAGLDDLGDDNRRHKPDPFGRMPS